MRETVFYFHSFSSPEVAFRTCGHSQTALRLLTGENMKGKLLLCESLLFSDQKLTFCKVKDKLL